ncbi:MAG: aminotransferase class IV [Bacteroidales bacterium]
MYQLLETIKIYNGKVSNLACHQKRMDQAYYEIYKNKNPFILNALIKPRINDSIGIVKCRLLYNEHSYKISFVPYRAKPLNTLQLMWADKLDYHLKYADRSELNYLLNQRKKEADDILIVQNNMITDTSYTNIAFFNGTSWFTPDTPLLKGTKRQSLIDKKIITAVPVELNDIAAFQGFRLLNSMLPFDGQTIKPINNIFK